jgi:hypothetical protein
MARLCPVWAGRVVTTAEHTGLLEGAQPLFDFAAALAAPENPPNAPFILAVVSSLPGVNAAVVFQKCL